MIRRPSPLLAGLLLLLAISLLPPALAAESPAQTYQVAMSDGVTLATDVHLGQGQGPWPVLLMRTPYGRKMKAEAGSYATVIQDVRGRGESGGYARPFFDDGWGEHRDGLDTAKWILAQPWCNGKIGTMGGSALGITQALLAGTAPPGVAAQHIVVGTGSMYHDAVYPGGVFGESLMAGWLKATGWPTDNLALILAHPSYDDLWAATDATRRIPALRVSIPALHLGGWYDIFTQGTIDSFVSRSRLAPNQWLIMGPWPHGIKRRVGELDFPPNALKIPRPGTDTNFWFDYWLRGVDNGLRALPRVQYYVMGACGERGAPGNEWRSADSWPIPARPTPFFLSGGHQLAARLPAPASLAYDYDPAHPVPTRGGRNLLIPAGPFDQQVLERRPDVLVFTTPRLYQPLEVTGRVMVRLWAASTARDTTFMAKLCDVYPDGRSLLIADGAIRAACRRSRSRPEPLEPGRPYQLTIDLGSTSLILNRGHRLRVDISSSNAPRFAVHPNVWGEGSPQVAHQTVYLGPDHPSLVLLPVVPQQWAPATRRR
jgi:hypothetical protein